ncbi:putative major capsid protein [Salmonella phage SPFM12]|nr:putative major capsid protein [Salmonella phage SPFM12]
MPKISLLPSGNGGNAGDVGGGTQPGTGGEGVVEEKLAFNVTTTSNGTGGTDAHICHCPITGLIWIKGITKSNINIQRNGATSKELAVQPRNDGSYCVLNWGNHFWSPIMVNEADGSWTRRLQWVLKVPTAVGDRYEYEVITTNDDRWRVKIATDEPTAAMLLLVQGDQRLRFMPALRLLTADPNALPKVVTRQGLVQRIGDQVTRAIQDSRDYEVDKVIQSLDTKDALINGDKPAIRGLGRHWVAPWYSETQTLSYTEAVKNAAASMITPSERLDDLVSAVNIRNEMLAIKLQYGSPIMTKSPVGVEYDDNENRRTQGLLLDPIWEQENYIIIDNLKLELLGWRFDGTRTIEGLYDATGTAVDIESGTGKALFTNGQFSGRVDVTAPSLETLAALAQNDYTIRYSMNISMCRTVFSLNAKSLDWKGAEIPEFATFQRPPEGDGRELVLQFRKPTEEAKDGALIKLNVRDMHDETDEIAPGAALGSLLLSVPERRLNLFQLSAHPGIVQEG